MSCLLLVNLYINAFKLSVFLSIMDSYNQLIEKIASLGKVEKEEVERKVEAKRAKLSGLVSKEGAAQIVAAEMGINFEKERLKVSELVQGMKKAHVIGKIVEISPVRSYSKNGREGKIGKMVLADDSGMINVVLWDNNHIILLETNKVKVGDVIDISSAMVRNGELHLSSFSDMRLSKEEMKNVATESVVGMKKIKDLRVGEKVKLRAFIVQSFEPRYFEVCPECRRKVVDGECATHGKVEAKKRALLNIVVDDGTDSMRGVIFGDNIRLLGLNDEEIFSLEKFAEKKDSILGEEFIFMGNVRSNSLYNTIELNFENIEPVKIDSLIKEFEQ